MRKRDRSKCKRSRFTDPSDGGYIFSSLVILIILAILILFGGKKIPELMKGLGKGMKEFKDSQNGVEAEPAPAVRSEQPRV